MSTGPYSPKRGRQVRRRLRKIPCGVGLLAFHLTMAGPTAAAGGAQQAAHGSHPPAALRLPRELVERPTSLRHGIGTVHDPVTTVSRDAQRFYDQGLACLHSFSWIDAARSFHQALRLDPGLAMAHLGLSYAFSGLNAATEARAALRSALSLRAAATPRERRRIDIRARAIESEDRPHDAAMRTAYVTELDRAVADDPGDVELWLLRGHAAAAADAPRYYEKALGIVPDYFAAHHFLVHAYENVGRIDSALRHSEAFARLAPAVPHAHHMYGHDLRRLGRVDAAIAAFRKAYELETHYYRTEQIAPEHDWHHQHNLALLATSYQYVGETRLAAELLQRTFTMPSLEIAEELNKRAWPLFLMSRGRSQEALAAARQLIAHSERIIRAAGHVAAGQTALTRDQLRTAADEANAALAELRQAGELAKLVAPDLEALQGAFLVRTGQRERGRAMLRESIRKIRAEPGPDAWTMALFRLEAIAREARRGGDWESAQYTAQSMHSHDTNYGGTHYALGLAAEHFGQREEARKAYALAAQAWKRADEGLTELTDARTRLAALTRPAGR
jgi:tetratricopeptide (TPR) repeat protein